MESRNPLNLQLTVAGVGILILLGGALWFGLGPEQSPPASPVATDIAPPSSVITVHVSGAVVRPGVARVGSQARIADAVAAVGGATSDADLSRINLAAPVRDGEQIAVPSTTDDGQREATRQGKGLDLNQATADQLQELDGVGPVLALRIVSFRDANGPFVAVEDLLDVPGIGEAKLAGMRDGIVYP
ncbi:MAG: helix-hairpin-helix domain-containing protein [Actinomycetia bacterium]|nr:helix-hairpin-helix domain-containing protein [Actinomycetes bacterium]